MARLATDPPPLSSALRSCTSLNFPPPYYSFALAYLFVPFFTVFARAAPVKTTMIMESRDDVIDSAYGNLLPALRRLFTAPELI